MFGIRCYDNPPLYIKHSRRRLLLRDKFHLTSNCEKLKREDLGDRRPEIHFLSFASFRCTQPGLVFVCFHFLLVRIIAKLDVIHCRRKAHHGVIVGNKNNRTKMVSIHPVRCKALRFHFGLWMFHSTKPQKPGTFSGILGNSRRSFYTLLTLSMPPFCIVGLTVILVQKACIGVRPS